MKKMQMKTVVLMILGVICIGISVGLLKLSSFGTDPFACMNTGVSAHLPISFGTYQLIVNIVLLVFMILFYRQGLGLGTVVNMVGVGYVTDFTIWIMSKLGITIEYLEPMWIWRIVCLLAGLVVLCFGIALYMGCNLGIAPYDALGIIVEQSTKERVKFKWARVITDIICVTIGISFGGPLGIATVITAFFTGPLVSLFADHLVARWIPESRS